MSLTCLLYSNKCALKIAPLIFWFAILSTKILVKLTLGKSIQSEAGSRGTTTASTTITIVCNNNNNPSSLRFQQNKQILHKSINNENLSFLEEDVIFVVDVVVLMMT